MKFWGFKREKDIRRERERDEGVFERERERELSLVAFCGCVGWSWRDLLLGFYL